MDSVLTIRIDAATQRKVDRLARARRTSRSQIVREALEQLTAPTQPPADASAYARVADLVGSFSSGSGHLSTDTGKRLSSVLRSKRQR